MAALEAAMKKHNINIDSYSSSHGHALSASSFSFNTPSTTTSSSDEWLIDSGASYHMSKEHLIICLRITPRKYLLVMIDLLVL
jgi:hypothetical protein